MLPHHGASFFYKKNTVKLPLHDIFVPNGNIFIVIFCTYIIYHFIVVCKINSNIRALLQKNPPTGFFPYVIIKTKTYGRDIKNVWSRYSGTRFNFSNRTRYFRPEKTAGNPKKLPEISRSIGKSINEFKNSTSDITETAKTIKDVSDVAKKLK